MSARVTTRRLVLGLIGLGVVSLGVVVALIVATAPGPDNVTQSEALSTLPAGQHLGQKSFSSADQPVLDAFDLHLRDAVAAGMDVGRVHLDWSAIEPTQGVYDFEEFDSQMAEVESLGLAPMITLGFTDVESYSAPADLSDPADSSKLAPGVRLSQPEVIARYLDLLRALEPRLDDSGFWLLSVANEPDALLADLPTADQDQATQDMTAFTLAVRDFILVEHAGVGVAVTISTGGFDHPAYLDQLITAGSVSVFNYGCLDASTFERFGPDHIRGHVDVMLAEAQGRQIVIQELSCMSGFEDRPSPLGATPTTQADWFGEFFSVMSDEPRVRAAFVLDGLDWPELLGEPYGDVIREEGLPEIADRFQELLQTWGLVRATDGSVKPSWDLFLIELQREAQAAGR